MPTGFEVGGLALAIVPLTIIALEKYRELSETVDVMRNYVKAFNELHIKLKVSMALYTDCLEILLCPLPLDADKLKHYLESEDILQLWGDSTAGGTGEALKHMLGSDRFNLCREVLSLLLKRLKQLVLDLKLSKTLQPLWLTPGSGAETTLKKAKFLARQWLKVRSGLKNKTLHERIDAIHRDVLLIRHLIDSGIEAEQGKRETPEKKRQEAIASLRLLTESARGFYESLWGFWTMSCVNQTQCAYEHRASLQIADKITKNTSNPSNLNILFLFNDDGLSKWNWRAVDVTIEVNCLNTSPIRIENLCRSLKQVTTTNTTIPTCIGFLEGGNSAKHYLYSASIPSCCSEPSDSGDDVVTLTDLILGCHTRRTYPLNPREKSFIAYHLANAVLQFHDTPWLQPNWTTNDVQLILNPWSSQVNTAQPVISKPFTPEQLARETMTSMVPENPLRFIKNTVVFSLGLALLELSTGRPVEGCISGEDIRETGGTVTGLTRYVTARRVLDEVVHERESGNLFTAIKWCIDVPAIHSSSPSSRTYSLENDEFRVEFYSGVVVPLLRDFEALRR